MFFQTSYDDEFIFIFDISYFISLYPEKGLIKIQLKRTNTHSFYLVQDLTNAFFLVFLLLHNSGLDFTLQSLERSEANPTEELSVSFTKGYEGTLRQYHGMLVRPVFAVRLSFIIMGVVFFCLLVCWGITKVINQ